MRQKILIWLLALIVFTLPVAYISCTKATGEPKEKPKTIAEQIHDDTNIIKSTLGKLSNTDADILIKLKDIEVRLKAIETKIK